MRVADVNGDGRPDIIGIKDYGAWFSSVVLLNRGARSFERGSEAGQMPTPEGLAVSDLNADGRPELIVSFNTGVGVLMNRGDGSFLPPAMYGQFGPRAPVVADFTGDSVPDVAVCNLINASVSIFPNIGDGRLAAPRFYSDGPAVIHRDETLSLVDLDGDGSLDLADVVSELPQMSLFIRHNQGNGILGPPTLLPAPLTTGSLVALDVEDEGAIDLVTAEEAGTLSVFTNQRDAGFSPFRSLDAGFGGRRVQAADFNSDQRADLLFVGQNEVEIFLNGPTLTGPVKLASNAAFLMGVRAADFNQDGLQDLVTHDLSGTLQTYLGLTDGGLAPAATLSISPSRVLEAGEFNGDGAPDLVVNGNGTVQVFLNARDGGFEAAAPVSVEGFVDVVTAADLNGDGRSDLVVATLLEPRLLTVLMSSPSGTLAGRTSRQAIWTGTAARTSRSRRRMALRSS